MSRMFCAIRYSKLAEFSCGPFPLCRRERVNCSDGIGRVARVQLGSPSDDWVSRCLAFGHRETWNITGFLPKPHRKCDTLFALNFVIAADSGVVALSH